MHHDRIKRRRSQTSSLQTSDLTSAKHRSDGTPGKVCRGYFQVRFLERAQAAQAALATLYSIASMNRPLRANKSETIEWLKFTLEGVGERTHGYAFEDTAF
jgi:hypothetical protein